jgi:hypothetical protein
MDVCVYANLIVVMCVAMGGWLGSVLQNVCVVAYMNVCVVCIYIYCCVLCYGMCAYMCVFISL